MRKDLPRYVYRQGAKGYLYFRRAGTCQRMYATPGSPEFAREYALILSNRQPAKGETWRDLLCHYYKSSRYTSLKPSTQATYRVHLAFIAERLGDLRPAQMQRKHVIQIMQANDPVFANKVLQRLKTLFETAIDLGWLDKNPARGVSPTKHAPIREREAPPPKVIERLRDAATGQTRLLIELALGTGQRLGDLERLTWQQVRDGWISFRQQKTDKKLDIPIPPRLAAELAKWPKAIGPILSGSRSKLQRDFRKARRAADAEKYDIHSLRYAAAAELAQAGCTDEQIAAITGHSTARLIALYAGPVRQRTRAKEAQEKRK